MVKQGVNISLFYINKERIVSMFLYKNVLQTWNTSGNGARFFITEKNLLAYIEEHSPGLSIEEFLDSYTYDEGDQAYR
jgi:hypothetical protein